MSYIVRNQYGAFCSVCQSHLSIEEDDWDTCDACGGEGIGGEDDEPFEPGIDYCEFCGRIEERCNNKTEAKACQQARVEEALVLPLPNRGAGG